MTKINTSGFDKKMKQLKELKSDVMPKAFQEFLSNTPDDTGYAKQNTTLKDNVIHANYNYAEVLDAGVHNTSKGKRGSNQSPHGMSQPTIDELPKLIDDYVKRIK